MIANSVRLMTVTDLHRSSALINELRETVSARQPDCVALVGDFLHAFDNNHRRLSVEACAAGLSKLTCPEIIFVRGNHEDEAWLTFASHWQPSGRPLHALHGEPFSVGPLTMIGFPCLMGDETAFIGDRSPLSAFSEDWLPAIIHRTGPAGRAIWLMHEPPTGTPLSARNSVVEGNPDWITAIERFAPRLTVAGHDHLTPRRTGRWHHKIGSTTCVNVGQSDHGPLHYCWIQADFQNTARGLPSKIEITAFPKNETLVLPPKPDGGIRRAN